MPSNHFTPLDMNHADSPQATPKRRCNNNGALVWLTLLLIALMIISALLLAAVIFLLTRDAGRPCLTKDCIQTASTILAAMDLKADPCEDFYQYACGEWINEHPIPDDAPSVSNFENLGQQLELDLKELLEQKYDAKTDGDAVKKAKEFYQQCLNETAIMATWRTAFNQQVERFGGWPSLINESFVPDTTVEKLFGITVAKFKADALFKLVVQPDDKNSMKHVIVLDQPSLNLFARDFYLLDETQEERLAYKLLVRDVLVLLSANKTLAEQDAQDILDFETMIANVTQPEDMRHDIAAMYTKITLKSLKEHMPNFDWQALLETVFQQVRSNGQPVVITDDLEIVTYAMDFLKLLDDSLPLFPKRTVINYVTWCWFFKSMIRDLPDPFAMAIFKFYRSLNLLQVPKLRWHGCVTRINGLLPMATSSMYIRDHFDHEAKEQVEEMIRLIMEAFVELLESEEWITDETKKFAKEKIEAMSTKIGYPEYLNSTKAVDNDYQSFTVTPGNYYKTKFQFYEMHQMDFLQRINDTVDKNRWVAGAAVVNAFYSPNGNEIIFPAGILQPVFYSKHFPRSMNFGGIGVVIGHEITHGFDDRGRLYDKLGNIREWWDNKTIANFEKKAQCMEDQYSKFVLEQVNMRINGKNTNGENIADNGGLKQAFRAYKKYEVQHTAHKKLPGIELTHDQLFFLNYAQIWCGHMNDKEAVRKLRSSEHSPGPIRVKGPLSNSQDFADVYHCPVGSSMNPNPEEKCTVW